MTVTSTSACRVAHLREVATLARQVVDPSDIRSGTLYVGLEHITSDGTFIGVHAVETGDLESSKFAFSDRHVLYGKLRPYLAKIARPNFSGVCSTDILPILPGPELDRDFLAHVLRQPMMIELATARATGANLPRLSPTALESFDIPVPAIPEQRRIAAILDKSDALRAKRRTMLNWLNGLTAAIFNEMFGDRAHHTSRVPLSAVTTRITDGTHLTPRFTGTGVPFIFVKNVRNGHIDFRTDSYISESEYNALYSRCPVESNDVLYTIVGATYGQAALVGSFTRFAFQRHIAHLKPDARKISPLFLSIAMQLPIVKRQADRWARGAAQPTVNLKELREFTIPVPPLSLQAKFEERASAIIRLKERLRASLSALDDVFLSLQQRAFTGAL